MTKAFFDAFPTVMPEDEELSSLLEHTTVTKVAVSEKRAQLRIYLDADRLIGKKDLEKVEKTFDEEFASGQGLKTKIIEHFHLSGQYTPKNLMRAYRSSILYELQGYQKCIYTMFRGADLHFSDEETCIVTVEDNLVLNEDTPVSWVLMLRNAPAFDGKTMTSGRIQLDVPEGLHYSAEEIPVQDARMARSFPGSLWRVTVTDSPAAETDRTFTVRKRDADA